MGASNTLPNALEDALRAAREALQRDPRGALSRGHREAIWAALGPLDDIGRKRRVAVAIAAVQRALPEWQRAWPRDKTPQQLLARASDILAGTADRKTAKQELDRASTKFDDMSSQNSGATSIAVGYGAVQTLGAALDDETFDPTSLDLDRVDDAISPDEHDGSYVASIAVAGGPPWARESHVTKRREFWEWWLREAVPEAWRAAA